MEQRCLYEFGPFRMDTNEKCLFRGDSPVALTPKAFDTLLVLAKNSGRTVGKEELVKKGWDGAFGEEAVVAQNVFAIRRALGPEYIETVPKRGYRFVAQVSEIHSENLEVPPEEEINSPAVTEEDERATYRFPRSLRPTALSIGSRHYRIALALLFSIAMASAFLLLRAWRSTTTDSVPVVRSIAVLPF